MLEVRQVSKRFGGSLAVDDVSFRASATGAQPEFEDDPAGRVVTLEIWDARFTKGRRLAPPGPASRA
jgi:hypothetical protein